jgi:hypothetical protein
VCPGRRYLIDRSTQAKYDPARTWSQFSTGRAEEDVVDINYLAVVAAALSTFVIGGLWYSPILFQKAWMRACGLTEADLSGGGMVKIFGTAFVFALVMSVNLAAFLSGPDTTVGWGATAGALAGAGWVALGIGTVALFERRPMNYVLINGGYFAVAFTVMGAILGAWR